MLVALRVVDEEGYAAYRAGMTPILASHGGSFGNDFRVAQALLTEATHPVDRVFTIRFPDRARKEAFYADPAYLEVKRQHFDRSVAARTILAAWDA